MLFVCLFVGLVGWFGLVDCFCLLGCCLYGWLVGCFLGWLVSWLVGRLVGWLVGRLVVWLGLVVGCFCLVVCFSVRVGCLFILFAVLFCCWFACLVGWLFAPWLVCVCACLIVCLCMAWLLCFVCMFVGFCMAPLGTHKRANKQESVQYTQTNKQTNKTKTT